jgi:hypothetical protein
LACILPARHGLQIGSGAVGESRVIPVMSFFFNNFLTPSKWWWASLLCHRSTSTGRVVAVEAYSARGTVDLSKNAAFESPMVAAKRGVLDGRMFKVLDDALRLSD